MTLNGWNVPLVEIEKSEKMNEDRYKLSAAKYSRYIGRIARSSLRQYSFLVRWCPCLDESISISIRPISHVVLVRAICWRINVKIYTSFTCVITIVISVVISYYLFVTERRYVKLPAKLLDNYNWSHRTYLMGRFVTCQTVNLKKSVSYTDVWHVALQLTITHHWRLLAVIF